MSLSLPSVRSSPASKPNIHMRPFVVLLNSRSYSLSDLWRAVTLFASSPRIYIILQSERVARFTQALGRVVGVSLNGQDVAQRRKGEENYLQMNMHLCVAQGPSALLCRSPEVYVSFGHTFFRSLMPRDRKAPKKKITPRMSSLVCIRTPSFERTEIPTPQDSLRKLVKGWRAIIEQQTSFPAAPISLCSGLTTQTDFGANCGSPEPHLLL
jgi:hypothetical protein